ENESDIESNAWEKCLAVRCTPLLGAPRNLPLIAMSMSAYSVRLRPPGGVRRRSWPRVLRECAPVRGYLAEDTLRGALRRRWGRVSWCRLGCHSCPRIERRTQAFDPMTAPGRERQMNRQQ